MTPLFRNTKRKRRTRYQSSNTRAYYCGGFQSHQLGGDGEAGAVLLGQFHLDGLGVLDRLQGSGQVLWGHLQADLVVLGGHALHLVLVEEVGLRGGRTGSAGRIKGCSTQITHGNKRY